MDYLIDNKNAQIKVGGNFQEIGGLIKKLIEVIDETNFLDLNPLLENIEKIRNPLKYDFSNFGRIYYNNFSLLYLPKEENLKQNRRAFPKIKKTFLEAYHLFLRENYLKNKKE